VQAINNLEVDEQNELEDLSYEFMTNAFTIFEEEIAETEQKVPALNLIVTTMYTLTCFGEENFETLVSNAISFSSKLLKKNMQCEAITLASHLFYCNF
jgi:vacuolar protein sorting-associated protein 35